MEESREDRNTQQEQIPKFRGLYRYVKISVKALDRIILACIAVIVIVVALEMRNPGFTITFDSKGGTDVPAHNQMYGELLDGKSVAKNWVVKKQQKDNFTYYYIFEILMGCKDEFSYLHIKTQIIVYDKDGWQTEDFASLCEAFWYYGDVGYEDVMIDMPRGIFWALQGLSVDELYELGKGSFDILEEVIGAWIKYESEQVKLYQ